MQSLMNTCRIPIIFLLTCAAYIADKPNIGGSFSQENSFDKRTFWKGVLVDWHILIKSREEWELGISMWVRIEHDIFPSIQFQIHQTFFAQDSAFNLLFFQTYS